MTGERFENRLNKDNIKFNTLNPIWDNEKDDALNVFEMINLLNELSKENNELKSKLSDCQKLKGKRLNKIRNHRAVIEDLGGSIRAYKFKLSQANDKINKIQEEMEDTGALTKRQLKEILNE